MDDGNRKNKQRIKGIITPAGFLLKLVLCSIVVGTAVLGRIMLSK